MKTFLIIVCCLILLYGFIKHILPKILAFGLNIYLSFLSDEKVEAYFVKQYQKYRENPKSFSDAYVESYVGIGGNCWKMRNKKGAFSLPKLIRPRWMRKSPFISKDSIFGIML